MHLVKFVVRVVAAALFLLSVLVPQYTAAPNSLVVQDATLLQKNTAASTTFWDVSSQPQSQQSAFATVLSNWVKDVIASALPLPSWERFVGVESGLLKTTDEALNNAAHELHESEKVEEFRDTFRDIVSTSAELREHMSELTQNGMSLDDISNELGTACEAILEHLKKAFPSPDHAPSHEDRSKMVQTALEKTEEAVIKFVQKYGMSEDGQQKLRVGLARLRPHLEKLVVITGDLKEEHPALFDTIIFASVALLIPESWILRPVLSVLGYGPFGPVKGSPAAWIQRRIWGAAVKKGSWFAVLQSAGMKGLLFRIGTIMVVIGGAIGAKVGLRG